MFSNIQRYYLKEMGIETFEQRKLSEQKNLERLAAVVSQCTRCPLHKTRLKTVFARGNSMAALMIIGEAPGFYEDQQGLPFVGKAGSLLNKMLGSIELSKEDVYVANVLKCRPPHNRDPLPEEISQCAHYLTEQIALVSPKLILAVGRFAGSFLLNTTVPLNKMRRKMHHYQGTPVIVSYHPAYLLRNPSDKVKAYEDLLFAKQLLKKME